MAESITIYYKGKKNTTHENMIYKVVYSIEGILEASAHFPSVIMGGKKMPGNWFNIKPTDIPDMYIEKISEQEAFIEIL